VIACSTAKLHLFENSAHDSVRCAADRSAAAATRVHHSDGDSSVRQRGNKKSNLTHSNSSSYCSVL
jgi:hypothetical protein